MASAIVTCADRSIGAFSREQGVPLFLISCCKYYMFTEIPLPCEHVGAHMKQKLTEGFVNFDVSLLV